MTSYSFCLYQIEQLQQCQSVTDQGEHLQKWSKGFALFLGASNYLAINEQHCSVSERFMQNSEQRQGEVPHEGQRIWSGFRNGILREKMVLKYWNWFGKCIRCSLPLFSWKMQVPINYTDDAVVKRSSCSHLYLQCFHWVPLITICLGSQLAAWNTLPFPPSFSQCPSGSRASVPFVCSFPSLAPQCSAVSSSSLLYCCISLCLCCLFLSIYVLWKSSLTLLLMFILAGSCEGK